MSDDSQSKQNVEKKEDVKLKIVKEKKTFLITIPNATQKLGLKAKQRMAVYSDDYSEKKMYAIPLMENQPDPTYECHIRKLNARGKYSLTLSIPPKIMNEFLLEEGDYLLVRTSVQDGFTFLVFKPDKPNSETRIFHNDDGTSTINKSSLNLDGSVDVNKPIFKETVPTGTANKMIKNIEAGGKNVPKIFEYSNIDLFVPDNYEGENFLTSDDIKKDAEHKKLKE